MSTTVPANRKTFQFRHLHPRVRLGTASDRYAGWLGQIYSSERYLGRIQERTKSVGEHTFLEKVLPVDSVAEYFEHFQILEIDFIWGPWTSCGRLWVLVNVIINNTYLLKPTQLHHFLCRNAVFMDMQPYYSYSLRTDFMNSVIPGGGYS